MAIKYADLKGIFLTNDVSQLQPGTLAGGRNLLKRNKLGLKRRPGFGAFDVESAAAVLHGASITNARATFQFLSEVFGLHDGILTKYDRADSFDAVTKSLADAIPTFGEIGGYGILATGGRALKYDGQKVPSPLGSLLIADMEAGETWGGDAVDDTVEFVTGNQSQKSGTIDGAASGTADLDLTTLDAISDGDLADSGGSVNIGRLESDGDSTDFGVIIENTGTASWSFTEVRFQVEAVVGTVAASDVTVRAMNVNTGGKPTTTIQSANCGAGNMAAGWYNITLSEVAVQAGSKVAIVIDVAEEAAGSADANEKLLLHMDGTDGASSFTDSSTGNHTVTAVNSATTEEDQKKFGATSMYGANEGQASDDPAQCVSLPSHADWNFSGGIFTVDFWFQLTEHATFAAGDFLFIAHTGSYDQQVLFSTLPNKKGSFQAANTTSGLSVAITTTTEFELGVWYHIAVVENGNDFYLFVNGVLDGSDTDANRLANSNHGLWVGARYSPGLGDTQLGHRGYIDEFRVLNGTAAWTANFDPYTGAYPAIHADYITLPNNTVVPAVTRHGSDVDAGTWNTSSSGPQLIILSDDDGIDLYTNYPDKSAIKMQIRADTVDNVIDASSYVRFISAGTVGTPTAYADYVLPSTLLADDGEWAELSAVRGSKDALTGSDFNATGDFDWSDITFIRVHIAGQTGNVEVNIDNCYLLHEWAPPASSKVFVAEGRAWVVVGRKVYYSFKNDPNTYETDTYMEFPDDVVAILDAGGMVLFLTETGAWRGTPLTAFPDYIMDKLTVFGCVDPKAACEIVYRGEKGAAWISKNTGVMFWPGYGNPVTISLAIDEIFTAGGSNNQNYSYARSDETMMFFHPRYKELWLIYPTLFTGETNLKYGWVLDCRTGEWMPQLVWKDSNNLTYATVYRDPNDNLYKVLLTDSLGAVFHEGYVGSTELSNTTSKDGYVDGSTTGAGIDGYVDTWFAGPMTEAEFKEVYVKLRTMTTSSFTLNIDYRQATLGTGVDKDTYPEEDNVTYPVAFADMLDRALTASVATDVIERNIEFPAGTVAHGVSLRVGEVDTGGAVEWELLGIGWTWKERGGR